MAVLTISREEACGGADIGREAAKALGYALADKNLIEKAFHQYGFIPLSATYDKAPGFWDQFDGLRRQTVANLNEVMRALARHGNVVILGRAGFAVLGRYVDVLNVRIKAPFPDRLDNMMIREDLTERDEAELLLQERDRVRAGFVESAYHVPWEGMDLFDLVIDTGKIPRDAAVDILVRSVRALEGKKTSTTELTAASIEVERFMGAAVCGALGCRPPHWQA
ncbi:MAG: cytidylate kinase-like family protein [Pseudomonadota bacterium]